MTSLRAPLFQTRLLPTLMYYQRNYIIHTVGPIYSKDDKEEKEALLRSCYQTCLELAVANSLTEIVSGLGSSFGFYLNRL